jgi:hypothetical protein
MISPAIQKRLLVYGKHVVGDLYECNKDKINGYSILN